MKDIAIIFLIVIVVILVLLAIGILSGYLIVTFL